MNKHIAISVLGKDKPGIIADVSEVLFDLGCNIEDSSMTLLRSEFAMILLVALPKKLSKDKLKKSLNKISGNSELSILARSISDKEMEKEKLKGTPYVISVYGADKPGIVFKISKLLAQNKINITDVQTKSLDKTINTTYIMFLEIDVPKSVKLELIKTKLENIAKSIKVTVKINPLEAPQL